MINMPATDLFLEFAIISVKAMAAGGAAFCSWTLFGWIFGFGKPKPHGIDTHHQVAFARDSHASYSNEYIEQLRRTQLQNVATVLPTEDDYIQKIIGRQISTQFGKNSDIQPTKTPLKTGNNLLNSNPINVNLGFKNTSDSSRSVFPVLDFKQIAKEPRIVLTNLISKLPNQIDRLAIRIAADRSVFALENASADAVSALISKYFSSEAVEKQPELVFWLTLTASIANRHALKYMKKASRRKLAQKLESGTIEAASLPNIATTLATKLERDLFPMFTDRGNPFWETLVSQVNDVEALDLLQKRLSPQQSTCLILLMNPVRSRILLKHMDQESRLRLFKSIRRDAKDVSVQTSKDLLSCIVESSHRRYCSTSNVNFPQLANEFVYNLDVNDALEFILIPNANSREDSENTAATANIAASTKKEKSMNAAGSKQSLKDVIPETIRATRNIKIPRVSPNDGTKPTPTTSEPREQKSISA